MELELAPPPAHTTMLSLDLVVLADSGLDTGCFRKWLPGSLPCLCKEASEIPGAVASSL